MGVLRGVLDSSVARDFLDLLGLLEARTARSRRRRDVFGRLWEGLALEEERLLPDAWQSYLVGRILDDENPFSLGAERGEVSAFRAGAGGAGPADVAGDVRVGRGGVARQGRVGRARPGRHLGSVEGSRARGGVPAPHHRAQALGGRRLGSLRAASGGPLYPMHGAGPFGRHAGFPVEGREAQGRRPSRPGEARRADLLRAGAGTLDPEHGALPGRAPRPPRPPLRSAGNGQILHRQSRPQRVRGRGLRLVEVKKEDLAELAERPRRPCAGAGRGSSSS